MKKLNGLMTQYQKLIPSLIKKSLVFYFAVRKNEIKYLSKPRLEEDLHCTLSEIKPHMKEFVAKKLCQM